VSNPERLRTLRLTKELGRHSNSQLRALLSFVDEISVPAGTQLAEEGRLCHQFLIVAEGQLETCQHGRQGKLGPGESFGWQAMHEQGWHDATVMAATCVRLLVMSHEQFRAIKALATEPS
jgi:CRP-like cAMP-binding protein